MFFAFNWATKFQACKLRQASSLSKLRVAKRIAVKVPLTVVGNDRRNSNGSHTALYGAKKSVHLNRNSLKL